MKTLNEYIISESADERGIKALAKKNGCPLSGKLDNRGIYLIKSFAKGFRGGTILKELEHKLQDANWTVVDGTEVDKVVPDGSRVDFDIMYVSPDEELLCAINRSYGGTSADNYYSAKFCKTIDFEAEVNKEKNLEMMRPLLKQLGIWMPDFDRFDGVTYVDRPAKDLEGKIPSGFKKKGDDEWESKDFIIKVVPAKDGEFFSSNHISIKNPRNNFKLL